MSTFCFLNVSFSVFNSLGEVLANPVNVLIPEAHPNRKFRVSEFTPSGLKGYLKIYLPPFTSRSLYRRKQQSLALIGATGNLSSVFLAAHLAESQVAQLYMSGSSLTPEDSWTLWQIVGKISLFSCRFSEHCLRDCSKRFYHTMSP